jgi:hypothetical protein
MNTLEIRRALSLNGITGKTKFIGVFPADNLPRKSQIITYPSCLVANTDTSLGSGEHWVAVHLIDEYSTEYFDSYGQHPKLQPRIYNFLKQWGSQSIKHSPTELQSGMSSVCGQYCIFYLIMRTAHSLTTSQITSALDSLPTYKADGLVAAFVDQLLNIKKPVFESPVLALHMCRAFGLTK